jgi:peptidoglycan/LPS O-acetylase OafA/YrhL
MVICHHCGPIPNFTHPRVPAQWAQGWIANGWVSIDLFFVISGYLMASLLASEATKYGSISLKLFYTRRILRIWPPFYLSVAIALFVFPFIEYQHWTWPEYASLMRSMVPMLCFLGNFQGPNLNHLVAAGKMIWPLWSLCVEEQFYLFLPISLIVVKHFDARMTLYSLVLVSSVVLRGCFIAQGGGHGVWYLNTFSHLDPLMIGVLLGLINEKFDIFGRLNPRPWIGAALFVLSFGAAAAIIRYAPPVQDNGEIWTLGVLVNALVFAGLVTSACSFEPFKKFLAWAPTVDIGKKTYSMYLWHYWVLTTVLGWQQALNLPDTGQWWVVRLVISFAITYGIACLSWKFLEEPVLRFKDKFQPEARRKSPAVAPVTVEARELVGANSGKVE